MKYTFYSAVALAALLAEQTNAITAEPAVDENAELAQLEAEENWLDLHKEDLDLA